MTRRHLFLTLAAGVLAAPLMALPNVTTDDSAMLSACWEAMPTTRSVDIFLDGASGPTAMLLVSLMPPADGELPDSFFEIVVPLDPDGSFQFSTELPYTFWFPSDRPLWLTATFDDGGELVRTLPAALVLGTAAEEKIDFDWAPDGGHAMAFGDVLAEWKPVGFAPFKGRELKTGEVISEQWSSRGVHIWAENQNRAHPQKAIIFDSFAPTGGDGDLVTPGYGPGNTVPEGKLLIIAEDDVDADGDGLVDDPDDELAGGIIYVAFDEPVVVCSLKVIDLDNTAATEVRFFDRNRLRQRIPFFGKGDNDATRLEMFCYQTRRVEIDFGGSGGVAYLGVLPCPTRVDFDWSTFGVPTGLRLGEVMTDQFATLGMQIEAVNATFGKPDKAILFDTKFPTGGDGDLVTPGYGPGNDVPRRMVMIIAEDDVDADFDGYVDDPDDATKGGMLALDFSFDRWIRSVTLLDIESSELTWIDLFDADGLLIATQPVPALGDNSVQDVFIDMPGVRRFELHLGGSGALAGLEFCPEPVLP